LGIKSCLDPLIGHLVKWADLHTDRAAVIKIEIREADLVLDIGFTSIGTDDWIIKNRLWWAFPVANMALLAEFPDPLVRVAFIPG
jgi:hypothetical protein